MRFLILSVPDAVPQLLTLRICINDLNIPNSVSPFILNVMHSSLEGLVIIIELSPICFITTDLPCSPYICVNLSIIF